MKVIWLGQNGFLFVSGKNKVLVDPYLSDSLKELDIRMERGWSINKRFLEVEPDVIVLTNSHMDHTDMATLRNYIEKNKYQTTLLCCESAFNIISSSGVIGRYNNVLMENGSQWTHDNLVLEAVPAKTDDKTAIGIIITDTAENKKYYVTSDTLYNRRIFKYIPRDIDTLFLPINGEDGGMNMDDALRFAKEIDALHTVPVHFGMFDDVNPKKFKFDGAVIPEIYRIIPLSRNDRAELGRISLRKVFAGEERDMKIRLSEKSFKVENSKIVSDNTENEAKSVSSVEPVQTKTSEDTAVKTPEKVAVKATEEKIYDPLPAREAGLAYLQALKERQKSKISIEKASPLQENQDKVDTKKEESNAVDTDKKDLSDMKAADFETTAISLESDSAAEKSFEEKPSEDKVIKPEDEELIVIEDFDFTAEEDITFVENFTSADYTDAKEEKKEAPAPVTVIEDLASTFGDDEKTSEEILHEDTEEEAAPWSFDPFATEDLDGTLEVDSARGALAFETLESIQEISEEYDNVDDGEEIPEPYDDEDENESSDTSEVEIPDEVDEFEENSDNVSEETAEIEVSAEDVVSEETEETDEIDADTELIYSDTSNEAVKEDDKPKGFESYDEGEDEDMSDKIDAYIKELEKFERGDTADFSNLEF